MYDRTVLVSPRWLWGSRALGPDCTFMMTEWRSTHPKVVDIEAQGEAAWFECNVAHGK